MGEILKKTGLAIGSVILGATVTAGLGEVSRQSARADISVSPDATPTPTLGNGKEDDGVDSQWTNPDLLCPVEGSDIQALGVPNNIDASTVDVARKKRRFKNSIGLGTEAFMAEPGGLLVGPDFESDSTKNNPYGANPDGWRTMWESEGHIKPFSAVTQEVLRWECPAFLKVPEGGFAKISAGRLDVSVNGIENGVKRFVLPQVRNNNYFFIVRGFYGDNKQNTDRNRTLVVDGYAPGSAEYEMYEAGVDTNTAFISEGQILQQALTSHSGGTNLGDGGASRLTVVYYDLNSEAFGIWKQTLGREGDPSKNWEVISTNWK